MKSGLANPFGQEGQQEKKTNHQEYRSELDAESPLGRHRPPYSLVLASFALLFLEGLSEGAFSVASFAAFTGLSELASLATAFFFVGLVSDYFFGRPAADGALWAKVVYAMTPNWSQFWVADALEGTKTAAAIWSYVPKAALYLMTSLATWLAAALLFFEERELN